MRVLQVMHMDKVAISAGYDYATHRFIRPIDVYKREEVPIGAIDEYGNVNEASLNAWWTNRSIPRTRDQYDRLMGVLGIDDGRKLLEEGLGLSLSDTYWARPGDTSLRWEDVNFYDNMFEDDLGRLTLHDSPGRVRGTESPRRPIMDPSSSASGDLMKAWCVLDGRRVLLKNGRGLAAQEVYNEVAATKLYESLMGAGEYVPYWLVTMDGQRLSACEEMLDGRQDLVMASEIVFTTKRVAAMSNYDWCVAAFSRTGIADYEARICRMLACDFVLANYDRHYGNFGAIRDAETNRFVGMAPVYDSGNSLWCNRQTLDCQADYNYEALPFAYRGIARIRANPERQLSMLRDWSWYAGGMFQSSPEIVWEVLSQNENMGPKRIDKVCAMVKRNAKTVEAYAARATREGIEPCMRHLARCGIRMRQAPWEATPSAAQVVGTARGKAEEDSGTHRGGGIRA